MEKSKHIVTEENAIRFLEWMARRGGVAVWNSVDLSDPSLSYSTPARKEDGSPTTRPHWKVGATPDRVITHPDDVLVITYKEVKRFRVGVRRAGMSYRVTSGATRKINAAVAKAGTDATYVFDYMTQEAVILVPSARVPLSSWHAAR